MKFTPVATMGSPLTDATRPLTACCTAIPKPADTASSTIQETAWIPACSPDTTTAVSATPAATTRRALTGNWPAGLNPARSTSSEPDTCPATTPTVKTVTPTDGTTRP